MSITTTVTGPFYEGTGAISLSNIRRNFRARNTDGTFNTDNNSISFSDILRNTDVNATNPVIPDCDQNLGIQASAGVAHSWAGGQCSGMQPSAVVMQAVPPS